MKNKMLKFKPVIVLSICGLIIVLCWIYIISSLSNIHNQVLATSNAIIPYDDYEITSSEVVEIVKIVEIAPSENEINVEITPSESSDDLHSQAVVYE